MSLTAEDRVALLLGRQIIRGESLQVQLNTALGTLAALQAERLSDEQVDMAADGKSDFLS